MKAKTIILSALIVILVPLSVFIYLKLTDKSNPSSTKSISKNILYITQPVMSFSGTVDKIEGNTITISQKQMLMSGLVPPVAPAPMDPSVPTSPLPTPESTTLTYQVTITDKTQISQPPININYLFKTITPPNVLTPITNPTKLTAADIKVGQNITVNSPLDLRTLSGNTFEATMINLSPKMNTISGRITAISGNAIIVKAFVPIAIAINPGTTTPTVPEEKEYTVNLTGETEISRLTYNAATTSPSTPTPPRPENLSLSDLKIGGQAIIYSDVDVTTVTQLSALRIEPMIEITTPVAPPIN